MIDSKLNILQKVLENNSIESFLIPSTDEFLSEYSPPYLKRLEYICGFSGSNGILLASSNGKHVLFTDGRYLIQARNELPQNVKIINLSEKSVKNYIDEEGIKLLAYDPRLHSSAFIDNIKSDNCKLLPIKNPIDEIWENRPKMPNSMPFMQNLDYIADFPQIKLTEILGKFATIADKLLVADPESICYLLNIRGTDIPCNPVILSYIFISKSGDIDLFTYKPSRFDYLKEVIELQIKFHDINNLEEYISGLNGQKIAYNIPKTQDWFRNKFDKNSIESVSFDDGLLLMRAVKKDNEIEGAKKAHIMDAIAVINAIYRIKHATTTLNEMDIAQILLEERKKYKEFICESFPSICGFASNGAIIHYRATEKSAKPLVGTELLLVDSGGHYESGTTDITRTILIGNNPKDKWKECYTAVLQGHINLLDHDFNENTIGSELDAIARKPIQDIGYDYEHGTGHGVGNLLNVHEGPFHISKRHNPQKIMKNMIMSNEPGIYIEGEFGIRIENLMFCKEVATHQYGFESLTLVPYEKDLILFEKLDTSQINWLKHYYKMISSIILPQIKDNNISAWLKSQLEF
ncbi:MAG: M24 family metallopeptidase [Alphaproteobacteria bacterium]|nr:M24 family metallopeptidase [Alphaproteobacteria bacterium]OJV14133.1 MAG: hypothetical protein BGO27_01435 [Alphaproteobacteria bacterium 33-17]